MAANFDGAAPLALSRSKLALFLECPRCFHLNVRHKLPRLDSPPFRLNLAVDSLLKREFDEYRAAGQPHPLMTASGVDGVPFSSPELPAWRDWKRGLRMHHQASGIELYGALDDVWQGSDGTLSVVDYKATSARPPFDYADEYHRGYRQQLEVYRWLLGHHGYPLAAADYWVIANVDTDAARFDGALKFTLSVLPYRGDTSWIDDALLGMRECLQEERSPTPAGHCNWCRYRREAVARENSERAA